MNSALLNINMDVSDYNSACCFTSEINVFQ